MLSRAWIIDERVLRNLFAAEHLVLRLQAPLFQADGNIIGIGKNRRLGLDLILLLMLMLTFSIGLTLVGAATAQRGSQTGSPSLGLFQVVVICVLGNLITSILLSVSVGAASLLCFSPPDDRRRSTDSCVVLSATKMFSWNWNEMRSVKSLKSDYLLLPCLDPELLHVVICPVMRPR